MSVSIERELIYEHKTERTMVETFELPAEHLRIWKTDCVHSPIEITFAVEGDVQASFTLSPEAVAAIARTSLKGAPDETDEERAGKGGMR